MNPYLKVIKQIKKEAQRGLRSTGAFTSGDSLNAIVGAATALETLIEGGVLPDTTVEGFEVSGPENSREEVTGLGTKTKSRNFSNSGFGGGRPYGIPVNYAA